MFGKIETIQMARAMTDHAAQRQKIVARNIANADTPGFKAKDLKSFADSYRGMGSPIGLRSTRPEHVAQSFWPGAAQVSTNSGQRSPNGNSVSIETEMVKTADLRHEHDLALGIYRSGLDLMRISIGRRV